jgi:hypothetical protein
VRFIWAAGRAIKRTVVEETVAWESFRGTVLVRGEGKRVGVQTGAGSEASEGRSWFCWREVSVVTVVVVVVIVIPCAVSHD